ncbi:MAG: sigma-70 family RNA polymerase sigma factor [Rhizobiales bacterium]|nr:sigma-70 family RNA polymerase sigma factor [Hyphomicrobiales bacterium]
MRPITPSNESLLLRVARQDHQAFDEFYIAVSPKLFGVVLRIIIERSVAEDVLHDAFIKIWKSASQFDPERASAMAWAATIARNTAIDYKRRKREVTLPDDTLHGLMDSKLIASATSNSEEMRLTLLGCLGKLEKVQSQCVVLAYCHGLSRDELSEKLSTPVNTIKTWLRRGLVALKECVTQ